MERAIRRASAALVLALLALGFTAGDGQAGKLTKVKNVKFTVADVGEGGAACGLLNDRLRSAFLEPLKGSGIKVVDSSPYFFFIRATTLRFVSEYCLTYVNAELLLGQRYFNPATDDNQVGLIRLWFSGSLVTTGWEEHPEEIYSAFRDLGDAYLKAWKRDQ
jgi:hypothetical protein